MRENLNLRFNFMRSFKPQIFFVVVVVFAAALLSCCCCMILCSWLILKA